MESRWSLRGVSSLEHLKAGNALQDVCVEVRVCFHSGWHQAKIVFLRTCLCLFLLGVVVCVCLCFCLCFSVGGFCCYEAKRI